MDGIFPALITEGKISTVGAKGDIFAKVVNGFRTFDRGVGPLDGVAVFIDQALAPVGPVGNRAAGAGLFQPVVSRNVIRVENSDGGRFYHGKQTLLSVEVIFHGFMIVQMVMGQIGEDDAVIVDDVDAVTVQSLAGDLHGAGLHAGPDHISKVLVGLDLIGSGQAGDQSRVPVFDRDRAHVAAGLFMAVDVPDDAGQCRFAVGAGGAEHGHFAAGMAVEKVGRPVELGIDIGNFDIGDAGPLFDVLGMNNGNRSVVDCLAGKTVSVGLIAVYTEKKTSLDGFSGIQNQ